MTATELFGKCTPLDGDSHHFSLWERYEHLARCTRVERCAAAIIPTRGRRPKGGLSPVLMYFLFGACVCSLGQHWSAQGRQPVSSVSMFLSPRARDIPHTFRSPLLYFPCRKNSANVLSKGGLMMQRGTAHIAGRLGFVIVGWPIPSRWASS